MSLYIILLQNRITIFITKYHLTQNITSTCMNVVGLNFSNVLGLEDCFRRKEEASRRTGPGISHSISNVTKTGEDGYTRGSRNEVIKTSKRPLVHSVKSREAVAASRSCQE